VLSVVSVVTPEGRLLDDCLGGRRKAVDGQCAKQPTWFPDSVTYSSSSCNNNNAVVTFVRTLPTKTTFTGSTYSSLTRDKHHH